VLLRHAIIQENNNFNALKHSRTPNEDDNTQRDPNILQNSLKIKSQMLQMQENKSFFCKNAKKSNNVAMYNQIPNEKGCKERRRRGDLL